ncbi:hypothetical protein BD410DRAFT_104678 [Rickenella mellea]|uniref:Uncharacterized protein n=1 Tax=Rickenella mellea TaxID=50990 RepID=A0A4Y7PKH7_9AGAM|nr:hypothetical protein BD410DRAFT_104678 [Rickenella mellea]
MPERPWFVKADDWEKMDDAMKSRVAAACPVPCENVPIDPRLETAPAGLQRIHNADRDGPNGLPYLSCEGRDAENPERARSMAPTQQGHGEPAERDQRAPR